MRALQLNGYGDIKNNVILGDIPKPSPRENEVLIEVFAASINPVDYKIIRGGLKQFLKFKLPVGIGYDLAGVVVEKGSAVTNLRVGDEVFSVLPSMQSGSIAEFIAVDCNIVAKKPSSLNFVEATAVAMVGLTIIQGFKRAGLKSGDKILIHAGSGGVGSHAIQYAKELGAYVFTTTSAKNVDRVKALGADRVIDYTQEDYLEVARNVDMVFDTLGKQYPVDAFKILRKGGVVLSIVGPNIDDFTAKQLGMNSVVRLLLTFMRRKVVRAAKKAESVFRSTVMIPSGDDLDELRGLVESGKLNPVVDKIYSLEDAIDALVYLNTGRARGKVVIQVK